MGRPSWDDYFFQIANVVSTRSTCDRAAVGALLVRDKRVLASGYNGSISGAKHCDEVGHDFQRVNPHLKHLQILLEEPRVMKAGGTVAELVRAVTRAFDAMPWETHCQRTAHAEVNALAQAAKYGIAVDGATLYCTHIPCWPCTKALINAGVKRALWIIEYNSDPRCVEAWRGALS